jgi:hypothetical protein
MHTSTIRTGLVGLAVLTAGAAGLLVGSPPTGAVSVTPPAITAHPDNVMVNTHTKLVGTGFAKHTSVTVVECSATTWYVLANPCDSTNTVTVKTNGHGRFTTPFLVQTCPGAASTGSGGGLAFLCYIGVAEPSGVDTIALQPYTSIVVTYP